MQIFRDKVAVITGAAIVTLSESLREDLKLKQSDIRVSILFPYFVQSRLSESGRHLPADQALYFSAQAKPFLQQLALATDQGISADEAAKILFAGISAGQFYIFTDQRTQEAFRERAAAIMKTGKY